ncbi:MAG: hypothetical protein M1823_002630 [Watsoniomyces obsoletus]|nr:MAG: hypothetical protein M1823_002630 [Watsoniomyces obsoletus]
MTAIESSPATGSPGPTPTSTPTPPSHPALPRLVTASKRTSLPRPPSYARNRISMISNLSHSQSRPSSRVFPIIETSMPETLIRDFAYSTLHPLHFGPAPESSEPGSIVSTPVSESHRRLSDPTRASWVTSLGGWSAGPWGGDGSVSEHQAPPYLHHKDGGGGPPFGDDDDLQSPVVSSRHKRHKTTIGAYGGGQGRGRGRGGGSSSGGGGGDDDNNNTNTGNTGNNNNNRLYPQYFDRERGYYAGTREDGSETYYVNEGDAASDGPGGEYVTYPPDQARHSMFGTGASGAYDRRRSQRDSHFAITLPNRSYVEQQHQQQQVSASSGAGPKSGPRRHRHHQGDISSDDPSDSISSPGNDEDEDDEDEFSQHHHQTRYHNHHHPSYAIPPTPDDAMQGKAVALFDFARENENELPLVEGQVIWVSYRHGQGWLVAEDPRTNESGLVPEEYVRLLRDLQGDWGGDLPDDVHDDVSKEEGGLPDDDDDIANDDVPVSKKKEGGIPDDGIDLDLDVDDEKDEKKEGDESGKKKNNKEKRSSHRLKE